MRFYSEKGQRPYAGEKKAEKFFAFIPITIGDETRWLEFVELEYIWSSLREYGHMAWRENRFLN
jgi:hypothetical protein